MLRFSMFSLLHSIFLRRVAQHSATPSQPGLFVNKACGLYITLQALGLELQVVIIEWNAFETREEVFFKDVHFLAGLKEK